MNLKISLQKHLQMCSSDQSPEMDLYRPFFLVRSLNPAIVLFDQTVPANLVLQQAVHNSSLKAVDLILHERPGINVAKLHFGQKLLFVNVHPQVLDKIQPKKQGP
jgi:hypothetical protein